MTDHAILTAEVHRELRVLRDARPDLGDAVMACITFPDEFRRIQAEFPILFRLNPERDSYTALAIFGFEDGENLFLGERAGRLPIVPWHWRFNRFWSAAIHPARGRGKCISTWRARASPPPRA